jgi:hypothetical protein
VTETTSVTPDRLRDFLAQGMLCSVMAAIDLRSVDESWAETFFAEHDARHGARQGSVDRRFASW